MNRRTLGWVLALFLSARIFVPSAALAEIAQPDGGTPPVETSEQASKPAEALEEQGASSQHEDGEAPDEDAPAGEGDEQADSSIAPAPTEEGGPDGSAAPEEDSSASEGNAETEPSAPPAAAAPLGAPASRTQGEPVYVNGLTGDDGNPGTEAAPVKTFEKAAELLQSSGGDVIYVTGALRVSGTTSSWDLGGKTLARGTGYHGGLVQVSQGGNLTLGNIVLDGRSNDGQTGVAHGGDGSGGSLVGVFGGSTLTVGDGAILQNNSVESRGLWYPEGGGAIFANASTVNVEGGTIRNNEAVLGGGIYGIYSSVINMSSGTIEGNRAIEGANTSLPASYGGNGGGICAANGTDVNLSGGTIADNSASERGGGISMGTYHASEGNSPVLTMTGGTIADNIAGSAGGGLFVQAGYSESGNGGTPTHAIAYITAGDITGNIMMDSGYGSSQFGGGGIYVNGYSSAYSSFRNGELYLTNVEVSDNYATIAGGGYAACPVSVTEISLTNGGAFYGNVTDQGNARELFIMASLAFGTHSGDPAYEISPSMLGGGAYRWVYDDGTEVPLDRLKGVLRALWNQTLSLSNDLTADDAGVQKALGLATVHITDNTSVTRGGGIGSNGSVYIGNSVDTTEISVSKTWDDANDKEGLRPASVAVNLYRDGEYVGYQTVRPDADGTWSMMFRNLPANDANGHEFVYTIEEREIDGYAATITGSAADGFSIANTLSVSVSGTKVWDDADNQDGIRPASITVNLMKDGVHAESKTVTADDGWAYSFTGLAKYNADGSEIVYTVTEDEVDGYTATVDGDAAAGFTVTNAHAPVTMSISVIKIWDDADDQDGVRPDSVEVQLYANGNPSGDPVVLSEDNQ